MVTVAFVLLPMKDRFNILVTDKVIFFEIGKAASPK